MTPRYRFLCLAVNERDHEPALLRLRPSPVIESHQQEPQDTHENATSSHLSPSLCADALRKTYEVDDAGAERSQRIKTPVNAAMNNPRISTHAVRRQYLG